MRKPSKKSSDDAAALVNHQHTELHHGFFSKQERHEAEVPNPNINFQGNPKIQNSKNRNRCHSLGDWRFGVSLGFGTWNLGFLASAPLIDPIVHSFVPQPAVLRLKHPMAFIGK